MYGIEVSKLNYWGKISFFNKSNWRFYFKSISRKSIQSTFLDLIVLINSENQLEISFDEEVD